VGETSSSDLMATPESVLALRDGVRRLAVLLLQALRSSARGHRKLGDRDAAWTQVAEADQEERMVWKYRHCMGCSERAARAHSMLGRDVDRKAYFTCARFNAFLSLRRPGRTKRARFASRRLIPRVTPPLGCSVCTRCAKTERNPARFGNLCGACEPFTPCTGALRTEL